jgi:hypothetical protein
MTKSRYPISRLLASFFGIWAARIQVELLRLYWEGPPTGCWVQSVLGWSWRDEDPTFSAITTGLVLGFYVAGGAVSWGIPRLGFFLCGMGWLGYFLCSFMSSVPHGTRTCYQVEWAGPFILLLGPAFWYFYACVKDLPAEGGFWLVGPAIRLRSNPRGCSELRRMRPTGFRRLSP